MAAEKQNFYGEYQEYPPFRKDLNSARIFKEKKIKHHGQRETDREEEEMQRGMEKKTKTFFIGEENWRKIIQCWEDFIDQDYEDRADALFSLIEELIHGNDPPVE